MTAPRLAPGQVVAGKYGIRALLGYGGATATYTAVLAPNRDVILKLFSPMLASRNDVLAALQQAVAVTNALPADSTSPVLESGFDPQTRAPFTAADLLMIPSLAQTVERAPLGLADVVILLRGIARAIDAAHAQRTAHGALKPQNVFFGPAPQRLVKVVDFGAAVARAALPTNEGHALATPWMAPEQIHGGPPGPGVDVFSAALVAFYAATGKSYWRSCQGPTPDLAGWQQEAAAPRTPPSARARELGVNLPPALDAVLGRALSSNPAERPGSVGELAEALGGLSGARSPAQAKLAMTMPLSATPFANMGLVQGPPGGQQLPPMRPMAQTPAGPPVQMQPPPQQQAMSQEPPFGGTVAMTSPMPGGPPRMGAHGLPDFSGEDDGPPTMSAVVASPYEALQQQQQQHEQQAMAAPQATPPPEPVAPRSRREEETVLLPRRRTGLWIALTVGFVALAAGATALFVILTRPPDAPATTVSTGSAATTPSTQAPGPSSAATSQPAAEETKDAAAEEPSEAAAPPPAHDAEAAPELAQVTIVCKPADCESIKIDGTALENNLSDPIELPPGAHTLTVGKATFMTQTRKVTLKAGQKETATFVLYKPGPAVARPCGKFLERCP